MDHISQTNTNHQNKSPVPKLDYNKTKRLILHRYIDGSGISGTGVVATGVLFPTGRVAVEWTAAPFTIAIHNSIDDLMEVHGHQGNTVMKWID